ncbi:hypothetical protein GJ496_011069 [Pomphorhynchus laevis]|nr:hypothetical protein GJ496_011069 [Pomphorhynchus laevis]
MVRTSFLTQSPTKCRKADCYFRMGTSASVILQDHEIEEIQTATGFRPKQIHRLFNRFKHLDKQDTGFLSREDLLSIPEVNINPLGERLVDVMIEDYGENGSINFRQFASILAQFKQSKHTSGQDETTNACANSRNEYYPVMSQLNSRENKLAFLFNLYDRDHDGQIDKKELLDVLKMMVGGNIDDRSLNEVAENTIRELDDSSKGVITFEQFCKSLDKIDLETKMSMKFMN